MSGAGLINGIWQTEGTGNAEESLKIAKVRCSVYSAPEVR